MNSYKVKHIRDKHHSGAYNMAFDEYLFNNKAEDITILNYAESSIFQ